MSAISRSNSYQSSPSLPPRSLIRSDAYIVQQAIAKIQTGNYNLVSFKNLNPNALPGEEIPLVILQKYITSEFLRDNVLVDKTILAGQNVRALTYGNEQTEESGARSLGNAILLLKNRQYSPTLDTTRIFVIDRA